MAETKKRSFREDPFLYWDIPLFDIIPSFRKAPFPDSESATLQSLLVTGFGKEPRRGNLHTSHPDPLSKKVPAEFFAYIGLPKTPPPEGGYPGVVMVHGGGGTAFPEYVKHWIRKGFAVIALDWYNRRPVNMVKDGVSIVDKVPLEGGFRQDHVANVANMVLCHNLLRSLPQVDPEKTVFVGLSWGSWYGAMLAAVDDRFKGGVEIYCGDVKKNRKFINGRFLHAARIPLYWIVSTNDQNMTLESVSRAYGECPSTCNKSQVIQLPHGHVGFLFEACTRMASHFIGSEEDLPKLGPIQVRGREVSASVLGEGKGIHKVWLCYTDSKDPVYHKRIWKKTAAKREGDIVKALIPAGAHQFYLTAYEHKAGRYKDLCGSTQTVIWPFPKEK